MSVNVAPSPGRRVEGSRLRRLALFAVTGLALAFVGHAQRQLSAAQQATQAAQLEQQQAWLAQQQAQLQAQTAQAAVELIAGARRLGLDPAAWAERRTSLRQAQLPRETVAQLLATSSRHAGRLFGAEEFELSVTRPDEGLFTVPGAQAAPLSITLRGLALIRTQVTP